jgi:hypothetical protein
MQSQVEITNEPGDKNPKHKKQPRAKADSTEKPKKEEAPALPAPVSIDQVMAGIDPDTLKTAEKYGLPFKPLLTWAKGMEIQSQQQQAAIGMLLEALHKIPGADEVASKVMEQLQAIGRAERERQMKEFQQQQQQNQQQGEQQGRTISGLPPAVEAKIAERLLGGESGGTSAGDKYFMSLGYESASLSQFFQKEMMKRLLPEAFQKFEEQFKNPFAVIPKAAEKAGS